MGLPGLLWSRALLQRDYWRAGGDGLLASVRLLMAVAAGCVLVFFSLPQSKLIGYILPAVPPLADRKSTRLNSSHSQISYAVFCLKKKKKNNEHFYITNYR